MIYPYVRLSIFSFVLSTKISFGLIGEIVSVPLPRTITSIWPLPFGLLLQQEVEANTQSRVSFASTSPLLSVRDMLLSASNHIQKGDGSLVSSHLILMDLLDEQQVCSNTFYGLSLSFSSFWLCLMKFRHIHCNRFFFIFFFFYVIVANFY